MKIVNTPQLMGEVKALKLQSPLERGSESLCQTKNDLKKGCVE